MAGQQSGLGKLIVVGLLLLVPVLGLALLMPALQSVRMSARKKVLEYSDSSSPVLDWERVPETGETKTGQQPAAPRAVVKEYDAKIDLTPKLSVGTDVPESIYVADFKATIEAIAPREGEAECQIELPLPPRIISLAEVDFKVNGDPADNLDLEGNRLVWRGPLDHQQSAEITAGYSATGTGVYTLEKPSGKIIERFRTELIAHQSNIRMLELSLQPNSLQRASDNTTYVWDYKRLLVARPIAIDVLGIAAVDRLGELAWLGPIGVLVFGILVALIALARDPEKLNGWLVILVVGCFAGAYPLMYFLQDFIDLEVAIVLATAFVLVVIAWRVISLFGLRHGVFGGIVLPAVVMALTIFATIHSQPAMQGMLLTIMGVFALVTAMVLLPRAQANMMPPKAKPKPAE